MMEEGEFVSHVITIEAIEPNSWQQAGEEFGEIPIVKNQVCCL